MRTVFSLPARCILLNRFFCSVRAYVSAPVDAQWPHCVFHQPSLHERWRKFIDKVCFASLSFLVFDDLALRLHSRAVEARSSLTSRRVFFTGRLTSCMLPRILRTWWLLSLWTFQVATQSSSTCSRTPRTTQTSLGLFQGVEGTSRAGRRPKNAVTKFG